MRRTVVISAACLICILIVAAFRPARSWHSRISLPLIQHTLQAAVTNPVEFAKSRLTGGVGVLLSVDPATGLPLIHGIGQGSPAQQAGLREGDIITKVDGLSVTGRPIAQIVENIRGLSTGKITLTVSRGSTNFECVVPRSSWASMRGQSFNPYE